MRNTIALLVPLCGLMLSACDAGGTTGTHHGNTGGAGGHGAGGSLFATGSGGAGGAIIDPGPVCDPCTDFPKMPIFDTLGAPPPGNSPALFGDASNSSGNGGPCLIEPPIGALFPRNWARPRFRFTAPAGQNLFEIRVHADLETNDLVVYTTNPQWTMPKDLWVALAAHVVDKPITLTVRSLDTNAPGKPLLGSTGAITIAPVVADGTMVYWAAIGEQPADAWLAGFAVGDESVITALQVNQVKQAGKKDQGGNLKADGSVTCIGCHTSTPDGEAVVFTDHWPWSNAIASIKKDTVGQMPSYVTPGGQETMNQPWLGAASFSKKHYAPGDRIYVTSYGRNSDQIWDGSTVSDQPAARLAWINLETASPAGPTDGAGLAAAKGTAWGILDRAGDPSGAMLPSWSHDGEHIVYVSTNAGKDGRLGVGAADLYTIPYNNKAGGAAAPVPGAADPAYNEYYPSYSPDDAFIAYNRIPGGQNMYYNASSEIYVIPAAGGTPTRLAANDAPACSGIKSPGITNSWAKWSPEKSPSGGKTYYWIIFSSTRDGYTIQKKPAGKASQLYMTGIVVENGKITTYPGVYLWNQPTDTSNNTPAWDVFQIPQVPPPK